MMLRRTNPPNYSIDVKVRELLKTLHQDGWYLVANKGSHRQFKHPVKPGKVTISGHPADEIRPGTLNSILKQARLRERV